MGMANIPDDWLGEYKDYLIKWPVSEQWDAILRGQLTAPAFTDFWDLFSGDPSTSVGAMDETFDTNLHLEEGTLLPAGMIIDFAGETIPSGWEICDFGELNRITEARLYAVIGTTYGPGDGTTTFNKPPASGRVNVALDVTDADFNTLGEFRGQKSVALETSEMPNHTHLQNSHNHTQNQHNHTVFGALVGDLGSSTVAMQGGSAGANQPSAQATATNISATAVNQDTGDGQPHNNIQPSIVFYRLIKT